MTSPFVVRQVIEREMTSASVGVLDRIMCSQLTSKPLQDIEFVASVSCSQISANQSHHRAGEALVKNFTQLCFQSCGDRCEMTSHGLSTVAGDCYGHLKCPVGRPGP